MMNCIIVDDDIFSTRLMSDFIRRTSVVTLLNSFDNAIDAIDFLTISQKPVDIIFLDIEMPEMSGLDFIKSVDVRNTQIIIYSSQEKYALESYEYDVCDYLLKPVNYTRFHKAINKAKAALGITTADDNNEVAETEPHQSNTDAEDCEMYIKDNSGAIYKVRYSEIIHVEALENYISVLTPTRRVTIHTTMKDFIDKIPTKYIVRTHRSHAIGKRYIKSISNNSIELLLGDKVVPVGKSFKDVVKTLLTDSI